MKNLSFIACLLVIHSLVSAQSVSDIKCSHYNRINVPTTDVAFTAQNSAADTLHISKYIIRIDTIDIPNKYIRASATITAIARQSGISQISLQLLQLNIDSIKTDNSPLSYTYNDTNLRIATPAMLAAGDSVTFTVWYQGLPRLDNSNWGGFYFSGSTYAFNMGVGFDANPHSFGRVWFPCMDVFTDKSLYEFHVRVLTGTKAFCNGLLTSETDNNDGTTTFHWTMNQPIPAYLASIAVAPFYTIHRTMHGIPVQIGVLPQDSAATLNTFTNLDTCIGTFVNRFGAHRFDKIGYVAVPFDAGAMEHATSIHIGKAYLNGTLNYESLWAHELAHHWWGDLVTCSTAADMWLNEGFATYAEEIFNEALYGANVYRDNIRSMLRKVLQFAHIKDSGYHALNAVPEQHTYSTTVYEKGAVVAHTLRHHMGDSLFFRGVRHYMDTLAFANADSYAFRDALASLSGINLTRFFDDWVATPGFPHFSIDSVIVNPSGNDFELRIHIRQKQKGNQNIYEMPVRINFTDGQNQADHVFLSDALTNIHTLTLPFHPSMITIDRQEKMSDAITDYERTVQSTGIHLFPETGTSLDVKNAGNTSSIVRMERHWVAPDAGNAVPTRIRISDYHYWRTDGIFSAGFHVKPKFNYDGTTSLATGYIDNNLITGVEDSLVLLYRPGAGHIWQPAHGFTLQKGGSSTDKRGSIIADTLLKGEYALGYYDFTASAPISDSHKYYMNVFPNPSEGEMRIEYSVADNQNVVLQVFDSGGRFVQVHQIPEGIGSRQMNLKGLTSGHYFAVLSSESGVLKSCTIAVR